MQFALMCATISDSHNYIYYMFNIIMRWLLEIWWILIRLTWGMAVNQMFTWDGTCLSLKFFFNIYRAFSTKGKQIYYSTKKKMSAITILRAYARVSERIMFQLRIYCFLNWRWVFWPDSRARSWYYWKLIFSGGDLVIFHSQTILFYYVDSSERTRNENNILSTEGRFQQCD